MADLDSPAHNADAPSRSRPWLISWLAIGGAVAIVGGLAGWLGWRELQRRLPDIISEELSGALGRPIKLGELQRFNLTGLRFGETILPPTSDNFTWARVRVTDISFSPVDLVLRRTFRPSLLLIRPEVSVKQRFDRTWVLSPPDSSVDDEGKIRTEIGRIRIRNADIAVGPVARPQIVEVPEGFSSAQIILLENVNLNLAFSGEQNEQVALNVGGRLKQGTFRLQGEGNIQTGNTNLSILGQKLRIDTLNPFLGGSLFLGDGYGYANLAIAIRPAQDSPVAVDGTARLQNGRALITGLPSEFEDIYGQLRFTGQRVTFEDTDLRFGPILMQVAGSVSPETGFQVGATIPDMSIEQLETAFKDEFPVAAAGRLGLQTAVTGPLRSPQVTGRLSNLNRLTVDRFGIDQLTATFSGDANALTLDEFQLLPTTGGSITARGQVDFDENVWAARSLPPTALNLRSNVDLPLAPLANLYGVDFAVSLGRLTAVAELTGPLAAPLGQASWQLTEGLAVGMGRIDYAAGLATLQDTRLAIADSGTVTATGQADLTRGRLDVNADARIPLDEIAQQAAIALPAGLVLGTLTARAAVGGALFNPEAAARWQLRDGSIPGQGRLVYAEQVATLVDATFDVGGAPLAAAGQADIASGLWDVSMAGSGLQLGAVSPQLAGRADFGLSASGNLADLSPEGILAQGDLAFSDGIPLAIAGAETLIDGPVALSFGWDGTTLTVPSLTAPGLAVNGQIATQPNLETPIPTVTDVYFDVDLADYDLARLNPLSPVAAYGVLLQGRLDFDGSFSGNLADPVVQGEVALRETAIGSLALLSPVAGDVAASRSQGGRLNLTGDMTEIRAVVGADLLPVDLLFRNGPVLAIAQQQGDWLRGQVRNFPLDALGIHPVTEPDLGVISGTFRSDFEVQLSTLYANPTANASFAVTRPALGTYRADRLQGELRLADGQATLHQGFLAWLNSRFDIAATADLRSPAAEVSLTTNQARIEDIFTALQIYDLEDIQTFFSPRPLGTAADLDTTPITTDPTNFPAQMEQAAAARAQQEEWAIAAARPLLPPLSDLAGSFAAAISFSTSRSAGIEGAFDISGQNWVWGTYDFANQFVARGTLQDQTLVLDPIRLESDTAFLNLAGQLGRDGFDTRLEIAHFDLAPVASWLSLPLPLQGQVNAQATLRGNPNNPHLLGSFAVENAALNQYPLDIGGDFSYQEAWLRFEATAQGAPDEPLLIQGQVPYALPFMTTQPDSDELLVRVSLGSGGFALLDMFAPYLAWGGGDGRLLIEATGPLSQPAVMGLLELQDANVTSEFLGESLTELNGIVGFEGDRIQVPGLQGSLLTGQFYLLGELPFSAATAQRSPARSPLSLSLDAITLNFENELVGSADGTVVVKDSIQSPVVSGDLALSNIRIVPGRATIDLANTLLAGPPLDVILAEIEARLQPFGIGTEKPTGTFDDFTLTLADTAEIGVNPLFKVNATGQIALAGPFTQPVADGYIEILDGWVN
ncbi:MAG: translocation/assembly module TamB domain-containing protein, partial [Leptolyngbyaceae cyanobacterium]